MKTIKTITAALVVMLTMLLMSQSAFAATDKTLKVGTGSVSCGTESDRLVTLDLKAEAFDDVNGVVFTLTYDADVFDYVRLVKSDKDGAKDIDKDDHAGEDPQPTPAIIENTIYYQDNSANSGRVLIAAAGAKYFTTSASEYTLFRAEFRVKENKGSGTYPIGIQRTIIGPDTALNAGYTENVQLSVAAGLAPDADPTQAKSYADVALVAGSIYVSSSGALTGAVSYGAPLNADADGARAKLFKKTGDDSYTFVEEIIVADGEYAFDGLESATYKVRINSLKPGYQRNAESIDVPVNGDTVTVDAIVLAAYESLVGTVTLNGGNIPGLKVKVVRKLDDVVIGYFNVDENGNFVTTALSGSNAAYDIYAVYGGVPSATPITYGTLFNYPLDLVSLDVTIACMTDKEYSVMVVQDDNKLEKITQPEAAAGTPETVTIENLISGRTYRVSVAGEGIPVTFFDDSADPKQSTSYGDADLLAVTGGQTVAFTFCNQDTNVITGTVSKNSAGQEIDVYAVSTDYKNVYVTTSEANGSYTLDVAPGVYMVYGITGDVAFYYMSAIESTQLYSQRSFVDADFGNVNNVNIILDVDEADAWFYGEIREKRSDGNLVPFALVVAQSTDRIMVTETNEQGGFKLEGFEDGETVSISLPIYPGSEETVDASNDGTQVNMVVNQGYTIEGNVVAAADPNLIIEGATVYLKDTTGTIAGLPVKSDVDGEFTLIDVTSDVYTIIAVHPEYKKYTSEDEPDIQDKTVNVSEDMSFTVEMDAGAYISGTVTNVDGGADLEDVVIVVLASGESYVTRTDGDGYYRVDGLKNDQAYSVFAEKDGYIPDAEIVTALAAGTPQNFSLEAISNAYTVSGTITDDGSSVADGTKVSLVSIDMNFFGETTTTGGEYSFSDVLPATDYVLVVKRTDGPLVIENVGNVAGNVDWDVTIVSQNISGTITLSGYATGESVYVYLVDGAQYVLDKVIATDNDNGTYDYSFTVPAGAYKIAAFCEGYDAKYYDAKDGFATADDVSGGETANITLPAIVD